MIIRESVKLGDKEITLETGRIAKQAGGSVLVTCGESVVLCTAVGNKEARPGIDFMPLTVDYIEKTYAAGKIPGGFFKREGRLREHEVLTSRLIDRPCRPLFPDGWRSEVQLVATVLSADQQNLTDVLALTGCSAALHLSPVPWAGPVAGVRVGRVDGRFIANPTMAELEHSDCDLLVAASRDAVVMVEGEAEQMKEEDLVEAIFFAHQAAQPVLELIGKMREASGKEKWAFAPPKRADGIESRVRDLVGDKVREAVNIAEKGARYGRLDELKKECVTALIAERGEEVVTDAKGAYGDLKYDTMRSQVLRDKRRVDGRDFKTVRPINIEVGFLPRTHGSTLFTRGETQAIVTTTLGTGQDEQKIDGLLDEYWKRFMLHYNFPPFSVGEARFMRGPGRREIGHGNLAERALAKLLPSKDDFPYTIRLVSEITESNGSSSMASVCGGSLALMDAGVPIKAPVAGVAMGLIKEGDDYAVLTDILGDEDHLGDMDFKVCGTAEGVTAIQMDIKIQGLSRSIMSEALHQAQEARLHILGKMNEVLASAREDLSKYAPRITTIKVKPDQIRLVIGPGGKMIKAIVDQTGVSIDVQDDGTVAIASSDQEAVKRAIEIILGLTTEPEVGKTYKGTVRRVERYGAFLEIAPGQDGLLHISDFDWQHVDRVEDIMNLGDEVEVKVTNIDRDGKIRLSRKELLPKPEGYVEREDDGRRGGGGGGFGGRDRDRGPRDRDRDRDRGRDRGGRDDDRPRRRRGGPGGPGGGGGGRDRDRDRGPRDRDRDRGPRDRDREGGERPESRDREGGERPESRERDRDRDRDRDRGREGGDRPEARDRDRDRDRGREGGERAGSRDRDRDRPREGGETRDRDRDRDRDAGEPRSRDDRDRDRPRD